MNFTVEFLYLMPLSPLGDGGILFSSCLCMCSCVHPGSLWTWYFINRLAEFPPNLQFWCSGGQIWTH